MTKYLVLMNNFFLRYRPRDSKADLTSTDSGAMGSKKSGDINVVKFVTGNPPQSKRIWKCAVEQHTFFRYMHFYSSLSLSLYIVLYMCMYMYYTCTIVHAHVLIPKGLNFCYIHVCTCTPFLCSGKLFCKALHKSRFITCTCTAYMYMYSVVGVDLLSDEFYGLICRDLKYSS